MAGNLPINRGMKLSFNWANDSQTALASPPRKESRIHGRFKIRCPITLSWQDGKGYTWTVKARGVDMSTVGARVESPEPLEPGSFTYLQARELRLMGSAMVRYCVRRGLNYRIGLEFRSPLTKTF